MSTIYGEFPYQELQRFDTRAEAYASGIDKKYLWAVTEDDDVYDENNRYSIYIYGDHSHYVNHLYHTQTAEPYAGIDYVEYVDFDLSPDEKADILAQWDELGEVDPNDAHAVNVLWSEKVKEGRAAGACWVKGEN